MHHSKLLNLRLNKYIYICMYIHDMHSLPLSLSLYIYIYIYIYISRTLSLLSHGIAKAGKPLYFRKIEVGEILRRCSMYELFTLPTSEEKWPHSRGNGLVNIPYMEHLGYNLASGFPFISKWNNPLILTIDPDFQHRVHVSWLTPPILNFRKVAMISMDRPMDVETRHDMCIYKYKYVQIPMLYTIYTCIYKYYGFYFYMIMCRCSFFQVICSYIYI